jgi:peroxiredoxin
MSRHDEADGGRPAIASDGAGGVQTSSRDGTGRGVDAERTDPMAVERADAAIAQQLRRIAEAKLQLQRLRRARPAELVDNHTMTALDGSAVSLRALFGDRTELLAVHNMGRRCSYCTLWADALNGLATQIETRCALVLVSHDPPETAAEFAAERGWRFRVVSGLDETGEPTFARAMGYLHDGTPYPGVSALRLGPGGVIERTGHTEFGPGDDFCPVWPLFDLLDGGAGSWQPTYDR